MFETISVNSGRSYKHMNTVNVIHCNISTPQNNVTILALSVVFSDATPPPQKQTGLNLKLEKQFLT